MLGDRCAPRLQGYISAEELLNIPELSINPLTRRLERMFDSVNFKVPGAGSDLQAAACCDRRHTASRSCSQGKAGRLKHVRLFGRQIICCRP
jgi:hypothetical protein